MSGTAASLRGDSAFTQDEQAYCFYFEREPTAFAA